MSNRKDYSSAAIVVLAAVIERNGQFLVCQRPRHKQHGSLWEFPGGKLESGETLLMAAKRELAEELGLHVTSVGRTRASLREADSRLVINFVEVEADGEPQLFEHEAFQWLAAPELLAIPLAPCDKLFAERLNQ
jgi:mutator protein MutT